MKTVVLFSLKGGTGRTTIACNLGAEMQKAGYRCMVVDADPQNAVGLHLSMQVKERFGVARPGVSAADFATYRRRNPSPVMHVPFGQCTPDELSEMEALFAADERWLFGRVNPLIPADTDLLIVDLPAGRLRWVQGLLASADLVLNVMLPDAPSYATLPATEDLLLRINPTGVFAFVVNQMDSGRQLSTDVLAAMGALAGDRLAPVSRDRAPERRRGDPGALRAVLPGIRRGRLRGLRVPAGRRARPGLDPEALRKPWAAAPRKSWTACGRGSGASSPAGRRSASGRRARCCRGWSRPTEARPRPREALPRPTEARPCPGARSYRACGPTWRGSRVGPRRTGTGGSDRPRRAATGT
ncbi:MAG: AAA family ATPase [Deltaproteobacteria bacterium]|nr:AAA family ATPase [Deltaproteobacteria bacterium]